MFAGEIRFTRRDTGEGIIASLTSAVVPLHADARTLFQRNLGGEATPAEAQEFRRLWQERVQRLLLEHADDPKVVVLTPAAGTAAVT